MLLSIQPSLIVEWGPVGFVVIIQFFFVFMNLAFCHFQAGDTKRRVADRNRSSLAWLQTGVASVYLQCRYNDLRTVFCLSVIPVFIRY